MWNEDNQEKMKCMCLYITQTYKQICIFSLQTLFIDVFVANFFLDN